MRVEELSPDQQISLPEWNTTSPDFYSKQIQESIRQTNHLISNIQGALQKADFLRTTERDLMEEVFILRRTVNRLENEKHAALCRLEDTKKSMIELRDSITKKKNKKTPPGVNI